MITKKVPQSEKERKKERKKRFDENKKSVPQDLEFGQKIATLDLDATSCLFNRAANN